MHIFWKEGVTEQCVCWEKQSDEKEVVGGGNGIMGNRNASLPVVFL